VFGVDNISVVFGWENRNIKFDASATSILASIHLISNYLGTTVHIRHIQRRYDFLSRQKNAHQGTEKLHKRGAARMDGEP
jgi:hypothetical protein